MNRPKQISDMRKRRTHKKSVLLLHRAVKTGNKKTPANLFHGKTHNIWGKYLFLQKNTNLCSHPGITSGKTCIITKVLKNFCLLKYCTVLFVISMLTTSLFAQSEQRGIVLEYDNVKHQKTPLADVEIVVANAGSTITDKKGEFVLKFRQLQPGDKITVRRIMKNGYEIFNTDVVEQWHVSRENSPFEILLVKTERLEEARHEMVQRASRQTEKEYERDMRQLRNQFKKQNFGEEEYKRRVRELERNYEQKLDDIDNYIERFVRIDWTELSAKEKKVMDLVAKGKFDEAIESYEAANLVERFVQQQASIAQLESDEKAIERAQKQLLEQQKRLMRSINQEVELLHLQGSKENIDRIDEILRTVAFADTTNHEVMFRYGHYLRNQGRYEDVLKIYEDLAIRARNDHDTLSELRATMFAGTILDKIGEYEKSVELLSEALPSLERYNQTLRDTARYIDDIAYGYHTLGYTLALLHRPDEGHQYLQKALLLLYHLQKGGYNQPPRYRLQHAMMLVKTAAVLRNSSWMEESEPALREAIPIVESFYKQKPYRHAFSLAYAWCCYGQVYFTMGDSYMEETEYAYRRSLDYFREAVEKNPDAYMGEMAKCKLYLGEYFFVHSELDKAIENYEWSLKVFEQKTAVGENYKHELSETYFDLGSCYYFQQRYNEALDMDLKALTATEPLFEKEPIVYRDLMSMCLRHMANVHIALNNYEEAQKYARRAMNIDPKQAENRQIMTKIENKLRTSK